MKKKNILIVEDESIVAMEIRSYLETLDYNIVATCSTADEAYEHAIHQEVDLILMDIYLTDSNGIEATRRIKKIKKEMPVIFLTAFMDEKTIDEAIAVNPVAYLLKPFNRKELSVAIKIGLSHLKPKENRLQGDLYLDEEFSFDSRSFELICCGELVSLSKKERLLLNLFLNNQNKLISNMTMEYELWPDKPSNDSRRRALISRLRSKLKHRFIDTLSSEGYVFRV
ncbi:MAG: Two-component hybrid sensor and regulator [uncultured Sulfurovum sp.]|uniref:Two-component hybrid sensor and regulator n=1 Tax=uncultured Sulfurovum sp. TaxID=269237 RepID=A0A6S6TC28_9BACT|nr:MAG: Two-component hybrid sensor and regulator [uncultured Sulfurovum sp.]